MKNGKTSAARGPREGSVVDQLLKLEVGESYAKVRRIDGEGASGVSVTHMKRGLAGQASKDVLRVQKSEPKRQFASETGITVTSNNDLYATLIITRRK